ncbi:PTS sugar transporter subunit IIA [Pectinatus frisingensis]|uniref:PTS sugar transporter subunit IIA n=1 Tax=Pectinatus frisingensis TaxID=865 RepID=UPI0018C67FBF|nr:PTS sugar transporter subunit IIA [Pectinatus frisingensis]
MDLDLIKIDLNLFTDRAVIKELGTLMEKKNYVKKSYVEAVLKREEKLPTGLNIGGTCVAIPHTDPVHVNDAAIAVARLNTPVKFHSMIDPIQELDVKLVFLLAVKNPKEQVDLLTKLMALFQNISVLKQIEIAANKETIAAIIDRVIC